MCVYIYIYMNNHWSIAATKKRILIDVCDIYDDGKKGGGKRESVVLLRGSVVGEGVLSLKASFVL